MNPAVTQFLFDGVEEVNENVRVMQEAFAHHDYNKDWSPVKKFGRSSRVDEMRDQLSR